MITKRQYVRALFVHGAGAVLALLAAFVLICVWLPVIKGARFMADARMIPFYVIGTLLCVGCIALAKIGSDRSTSVMIGYKTQKNESGGPNKSLDDPGGQTPDGQ